MPCDRGGLKLEDPASSTTSALACDAFMEPRQHCQKTPCFVTVWRLGRVDAALRDGAIAERPIYVGQIVGMLASRRRAVRSMTDVVRECPL